jgi:hypothetical protein
LLQSPHNCLSLSLLSYGAGKVQVSVHIIASDKTTARTDF